MPSCSICGVRTKPNETLCVGHLSLTAMLGVDHAAYRKMIDDLATPNRPIGEKGIKVTKTTKSKCSKRLARVVRRAVHPGALHVGTKIVCTLAPMDARKAKTFCGTVVRVEDAVAADKDGKGGWDAGIVVHYPTVKFRHTPGVDIFHAWPSLWAKVAA